VTHNCGNWYAVAGGKGCIARKHCSACCCLLISISLGAGSQLVHTNLMALTQHTGATCCSVTVLACGPVVSMHSTCAAFGMLDVDDMVAW
jgi:hypothetical protein